eukprot:357377_1
MRGMQIDRHGAHPSICGKRKFGSIHDDDDMHSLKTTSIQRPVYKRARFHSIALKIIIKMGNISKNIVLNNVSPDCSIKQLSTMICIMEKINPSTSIVVYSLKFKSETDTLRYCGISTGSSLIVSLKFKNDSDLYNYAASIRGSIVIFVKTLRGKYIWLAVQDTDTLQNIKCYIHQCERIPTQQQRFLFNGKPMNEHLTLREHGVYHLNSINLVLKLRGVF